MKIELGVSNNCNKCKCVKLADKTDILRMD